MHQVASLKKNFPAKNQKDHESLEIKGAVYVLNEGRVLPLETFKTKSN
jgi:carbonic anhydrase